MNPPEVCGFHHHRIVASKPKKTPFCQRHKALHEDVSFFIAFSHYRSTQYPSITKFSVHHKGLVFVGIF